MLLCIRCAATASDQEIRSLPYKTWNVFSVSVKICNFPVVFFCVVLLPYKNYFPYFFRFRNTPHDFPGSSKCFANLAAVGCRRLK